MEDFVTFAKGFMPIFVVESQWLKCLVMRQNLWNVFPNHKQMVQHAIPTFVVKTMNHYVIPILNYFVITTIISFDWWMFRSKHDTFAHMINFINSHWVPCHVTMGLFEATYTTRVTMITYVKDLLSSYFLCDKLITYVKDEGGNLWGWQIAHKKLWPSRGNKNIKRIRRITLPLRFQFLHLIGTIVSNLTMLTLPWGNRETNNLLIKI
jgi:hypothetical protein